MPKRVPFMLHSKICLLFCISFFFFNDTATTEIYTLSLHDALPIAAGGARSPALHLGCGQRAHGLGQLLRGRGDDSGPREHTGRPEQQGHRQEEQDATASHTRILLQLQRGLCSPGKEEVCMKMYVAGQWIDKDDKIEVRNSYDGSVIDTVPRADRADIERALQSAERGARAMAKLSSYERWKILHRAADLLSARAEELGTLISKEEGKILAEGRVEALRAVDTIMESAEEAKRVHGETVALDGASHGKGKFGVTIRVPCGVVVAISPFNFPLNLVCHKGGPAIAGGNAVIVKPATDTPLSALRLTEILLEAGLPPEGINALTGSGGEVGDWLVAD